MINWQIARIVLEVSAAIFFVGFIFGCLFVDYFITRPSLQALNNVIRDYQHEVNKQVEKNNGLTAELKFVRSKLEEIS